MFKKTALAAVAAALTVVYIFFIPCPVRWLLGVPCPTCGMTRSALALLLLDFRTSFYYHPLTVPFGIFMLFVIFKDFFNLSKKTVNIIIISGAVIIFLVYLVRLLVFNNIGKW